MEGGRKETNRISCKGMSHPDQKPSTLDIFSNTLPTGPTSNQLPSLPIVPFLKTFVPLTAFLSIHMDPFQIKKSSSPPRHPMELFLLPFLPSVHYHTELPDQVITLLHFLFLMTKIPRLPTAKRITPKRAEGVQGLP